MENKGSFAQNYSGSLLISHPRLLDPNFRRTVVLLSAHSREDGAVGVILNRPTNKVLGEIEDEFAFGSLARVPIYLGGPVASNQILLVAWTWSKEESSFKLFFGIDPDRASELMHDPHATVRAFQGYSGWTGGQLEVELERDSWIVSQVNSRFVNDLDGYLLWKKMVAELGPKYTLEALSPEDPSFN